MILRFSRFSKLLGRRGFQGNGRSGALLALLLLSGPVTALAQTSPTLTAPSPDTMRLVSQHTRGGVRFAFHVRGTGPVPQAGQRVAVRYTGFLPDGRIFDASAAAGGPLRFRVGRREVIAGWDELLLLLPVGSRVRAWIPAPLAYGATGVRDPDDDSRYLIPPNAELVFELLVLSVR